MAENKTKVTELSVTEFIDSLDGEQRRSDARALAKLMAEVTGEPPKLWGSSIIGFGVSYYRYESGREGSTPLLGFSPRKAATVLYGMRNNPEAEEMLARLGKHTTGKGCVYLKRLGDVDLGVLRQMLKQAVAAMQG